MRRLTHLSITCLLLVTFALGQQLQAQTTTHYTSPELQNGKPLYSQLLYQSTLDKESGSTVDWSNTVQRDGTPINIYFKSHNATRDYSVCFKARYLLTGETQYNVKHGCFNWFDTNLHSAELLTPEEALRVETITLHNYDVRGLPDWDGSLDPPGMLSHQSKVFTLAGLPPRAASSSATTAPSPSLSLPVGYKPPRYTDSEVEGMINAAAEGILFCAHPTGIYEGVTVDNLSINGDRISVEFTIDYQCTFIERPCSMTMEAVFLGEEFQHVSVLRDSAFTDANIGLDTCRDLINAMIQ